MASPLLTLQSAPALATYHARGHWQDETIYGAVQRSTAADPHRVAISESGRFVTYAGLLATADRLAADWATAGLVAGDRVAVWMPSRLEIAAALLACSRNGYVCCPSLHRDHTVEEVVTLLNRMSAAACLVERNFGADADTADITTRWDDVASLRSVSVLGPAGATEIESGEATGLLPIDTDPDSVVYLAFTSGTTGSPKGVMHSDNTLLAPIRAMITDWSFDSHSVVYTLSPLSHNLGFGAMILALSVGAELVVHDLPRGASVLDRVSATGATFLFGVPTHAVDLLAELEQRPKPPPLRVRGFRISGASISPTVAARLIDKGIKPQSGYGMTEGGSHHYTRPDDDVQLVVGSSGRPFAGHEVRIFSPEDPDREVEAHTTGHIGARGPSMMLGYFGDQTLTTEAYNRDGFFLSGDLGWVDEAGNIRITGRKKEIIIRGGHNIYPAKIEALAAKHPQVDQAVLVPVPDERLGERACLVVRPVASGAIDVDELLSYLAAAGLSKFDMPEYYLEVGAMPLTASGKILKRRLAEDIASGAPAPQPVRYRPSAAARGSQR